MSRYHKEQIECPHCNHKGEFDLWESVNVDLDPEFRRQILSDRLIGRQNNILDNNKNTHHIYGNNKNTSS